jgi:TPP-dependent 2-oxoacid decarboxylase
MPVVLTPMAKGLIPEDHACYAGVLFHSLSDYLEDIYEKTDLIIGLGYDPVEFNYESWAGKLPLVHFDVKETDFPQEMIRATYAGPPEEWFRLLRNLTLGSLVFEKELVRSVRDEMMAVFNGFTGHFGPAAAMNILREELPQNAIITADVGSHLHLLGQFWNTGGKQNLLMTNGWSGMGFGLPACRAGCPASFAGFHRGMHHRRRRFPDDGRGSHYSQEVQSSGHNCCFLRRRTQPYKSKAVMEGPAPVFNNTLSRRSFRFDGFLRDQGNQCRFG